MPRVVKRTGTADRAEGYIVETDAGGKQYTYELEIVGGDQVEVVKRTVQTDTGVEEREPEATDAVEDVMEERGFEVV